MGIPVSVAVALHISFKWCGYL